MDILNLKVGKIRKLTIKNVKSESITKIEDGQKKRLDKIIFEAEDPYTKKLFNISDAWVETPTGAQIKGLWLALQNGGIEIQKHSTLAKLIEYYRTDTLQDFVGQTVDAYPDNRNFLVLVACTLPKNL
jgi:hypothetical protein